MEPVKIDMRTRQELKDLKSQIRNRLVPDCIDANQIRILNQLEVLNWVLCDCGAGWAPDHKHSVECDSQENIDPEIVDAWNNHGQEPADSRAQSLEPACTCGHDRLAQEHGLQDLSSHHELTCPRRWE